MFHVKRVLCALLILMLALPLPALGAEEPTAKAYEEAVAELRNEDMYAIYNTIDTELCTVFLYRRIGTPHIQPLRIAILYKNGTVAKPDLSPEEIRLNGDGKQLICTDSFDPSWGTNVYTVDLASGEIVGKECVLPTQEQLFDWFLEGSTEERRLEGAEDTVLLFSSHWEGREKEYFLYLICREPAQRADSERWFRRLVLPSTTVVGEKYPQYPTDRAPDEMFLTEDGSVLTYVYSFEEALFNADGETLHEAGTYTYKVETATGELKVTHKADTSLPSPALGAEGTTFVDITPSDWFAPYVDVCVEEGLMKGVGGGRFSPQGAVTMAEAATIAARLHHLQNGGDGNLPKAPEEWGRMTLTFEDGEAFSFYESDYYYDPDSSGRTDGWLWGGRTGGLLYFERAEGWEGRDYQKVTLRGWVSDTPLQGTAEVPNNVGTSLRFIPENFRGLYDTLNDAPQTPPSQWYRDTHYYLAGQNLDIPCAPYYAQRDDLARALDKVVGRALTPINHITDYPDSSTAYDEEEREGVLRLYNAGILTGTDAAGSFSPSGYLTRAEVAAMAARILRPELRITFAPEEPVYQKYTLTELEGVSVGDWFERLSPDLVQFDRMDEGRVVGEALLRSDGTVIDLPEGSHLDHYTAPTNTQPWPLLVLSREDLTMPGGYSYGIMDPLSGEMVVPFGPYAGNGTYPGAGECTVVENGRMILTREASWDDKTWVPLLLRDDKGQVVQELPEREGLEVYWGRLENGLAPAYDQAAGLWGFVDLKGNWAIQPQYCNYDSFFVRDRAVACREDENGNWRYGVIDSQGREVLPFRYPGLSYRGDGLYRTDPISADPGELYWVREDGSEVRNGYMTHDIYCVNGYIALYNQYLDGNFQYATPAEFDWTGPINETGSGFVGKDGKVYRIQFER